MGGRQSYKDNKQQRLAKRSHSLWFAGSNVHESLQDSFAVGQIFHVQNNPGL
jgi:hypothetical protein